MRLMAGVALAVLVAGVRMPAGQSSQRDDLPDGPGKKILQAACTSCHELTEVTKLKGYYSKDDWRDVVVTMVKYGAVLKDKEPEVLVDYLTAALGKKPAP
jgi:virginiamycin B lyase